LTQKIEFIPIVRDLNQVNPSIKIENCDGFCLRTGADLHFLLHAICNPFATVCNHLQPGLAGMVKKGYFKGFTPIITDLTGLKPPKVGLGGNGKPLPLQSH
jgi:hypothetical protein